MASPSPTSTLTSPASTPVSAPEIRPCSRRLLAYRVRRGHVWGRRKMTRRVRNRDKQDLDWKTERYKEIIKSGTGKKLAVCSAASKSLVILCLESLIGNGVDLQTSRFTLRQIKTAINNFDLKNKIGEGGFGPVYKIADFGLSKLDEEDNTHISIRIAGTFGYMAPEYAMQGYLTDKADAYSYGVVVLEIVSGRGNTTYQQQW